MKNRKFLFDLLTTVIPVSLLIIIDQIVKSWAYGSLYTKHNGNLTVIKGLVSLDYAENTGAAWSILEDAPWVFISLSIIVVIAILIYIFAGKRRKPLLRISLLFLLSGGIGNLIDRLFRTGSHFSNRNGYVIDMFRFDFIDFPIFNFADVCVCVGGAIFVLYMLIYEMKETK